MSAKTEESELLKLFKTRMAAVARANEDEFKTVVTFDESGYYIEVTETADGHTFLDGHGPTMSSAIEHALKNLPAALESWSYSDTK